MPNRDWTVLFAGFALITFALMPPGNVSGDGASMLRVGTSLATGNGFAVPCDFGIPGRDGRCFSTYYPLQSVLAVPFIAAVAHSRALHQHRPTTSVGSRHRSCRRWPRRAQRALPSTSPRCWGHRDDERSLGSPDLITRSQPPLDTHRA
jgi:hypothetical protein